MSKGTSSQHAGSDWGFAARGLTCQDVDDIEGHMLQLLQLPGLSDAARTTAGDADSWAALDVERKVQQGELKVRAVPACSRGAHTIPCTRSSLPGLA